MSDDEFYEQFHRKGGDYLMPDRVFEDLLYEKEELEKENKKLKKELEKLQKSQIFIDTQDIEERYAEGKYQDYLEEKVKELKKQLEEKEKKYIPGEYAKEEYIKEFDKNILLKKQQQEFIKYLKQCIENEKYCYLAEKQEDRVRKDIFEEILAKYKEIIGVKDENNT